MAGFPHDSVLSVLLDSCGLAWEGSKSLFWGLHIRNQKGKGRAVSQSLQCSGNWARLEAGFLAGPALMPAHEVPCTSPPSATSKFFNISLSVSSFLARSWEKTLFARWVAFVSRLSKVDSFGESGTLRRIFAQRVLTFVAMFFFSDAYSVSRIAFGAVSSQGE